MRVRPWDVPPPSTSASSGDEETFSWVGSPHRVSSFWPAGAEKRTASASAPGATGVRLRCTWAAPSSTVCAFLGTGTRTRRCALVSTTTSTGSSCEVSSSTSEGSASPRVSVETSPVAGS